MNKPLYIIEMFKSINGEGDELGRRTVFVRTFGCSAKCPGCDTPYAMGNSKDAKMIFAGDIFKFCKEAGIKHITFTGGEPFEQKYFREYIPYLLQHGYKITIETNGLIPPGGLNTHVHVVVSPKPWMLIDKHRDSYFYWARWGATFKFTGAPDDVTRIRKWFKIFRLEKAYVHPWVKPGIVNIVEYRKAYIALLKEVHKKFDDNEDVRVIPQWHKVVWPSKTRGI